MIKLLFIILLIGVTLKISNYFLKIQYFRNNVPQEDNKNRKSGMDIMDGDYEEVE